MLVPNNHFNYDGDIVFTMENFSEDPVQKKKFIFDRKKYEQVITVNPIDMKVIKIDCDCEDFKFNKKKLKPCKHIKEDLKTLEQYGVIYDEENLC